MNPQVLHFHLIVTSSDIELFVLSFEYEPSFCLNMWSDAPVALSLYDPHWSHFLGIFCLLDACWFVVHAVDCSVDVCLAAASSKGLVALVGGGVACSAFQVGCSFEFVFFMYILLLLLLVYGFEFAA